ncbi:MAG: EAL domain-containing protein, partial [Actinomycetota bacterium]|nr:EAL domain-containing protein [Actinomycetota bacterium]
VRHFTVRRGNRLFDATIFTDARDQVALREAYGRLSELVTTDALTGLPNRLLADDRLRLSVNLAKRDERPVAVLFIDLDRFKLINDTLGHPAGDQVLRQVADRLRSAIRESDTVARVGGDEFIVILHAIAHATDAELVARSVLESLAGAFVLDEEEVFIGASVGIAIYPVHGEAPDALRSHADLAMYEAKAEGGNAFRVYVPAMSEQSREKLLIAGELHRGLDRDELVVHYQPQIDIDSGLVVGAEALVRWQHPTRGLVPPAVFLGVAEDDGSILEIDRWVLRTACEQTRRWDEEGLHLPMVAVNLSARTMLHGDVVGMVAEALASSRLAPERLELEVSEHVVAGQVDGATVDRLLAELKSLGVQLAIDDFGTGYSSLGHLQRFPIDAIKLDRSFVVDVTEQPGPTDIAVLRAVVAMAGDLDLRCIAEGVETIAQRRVLKYLQCHIVQGYLYSRPVGADDFRSRLEGPVVPTVALAGG